MSSIEHKNLGFFTALLHYGGAMAVFFSSFLLLGWVGTQTNEDGKGNATIVLIFIFIYLSIGIYSSQFVRRKIANHIGTEQSAVAYWLLWPILYPILIIRYGIHKMLG